MFLISFSQAWFSLCLLCWPYFLPVPFPLHLFFSVFWIPSSKVCLDLLVNHLQYVLNTCAKFCMVFTQDIFSFLFYTMYFFRVYFICCLLSCYFFSSEKCVKKTWLEKSSMREHSEDLGIDGVNIKMDIKEIKWESVDWIYLLKRHCWQVLVYIHDPLGSIKCGEFIDGMTDHQLLKKNCAPWSYSFSF